MKPHEFLDDETRDELAQHVLGTLPPSRSRGWALHVAGCSVCRREIEELHAVVGALGALGPRLVPRPNAWMKIQERIRAEPASGGKPSPFHRILGALEAAATADPVLVRSGEEPWRSTGVPGVEIRTLHVDRTNDRATILARMAPGSSYPAHVHAGPEECYVLQGDLTEGGRKMVAGDYQRAPEGSRHEVETTEQGCLLLIVSSMSDRMV